MTDVATFFTGKTVLVTGASGMLGRRLVDRLIGLPVNKLVLLSRRGVAPTLPIPRFGLCEVVALPFDLGDERSGLIDLRGIDHVFHLAGIAAVAGGSAIDHFNVNCLGTVRLLEACRHAGGRDIVFASTAHVYAQSLGGRIGEDHPVDPGSPYGASKLAGELALQQFARGSTMKVSILRFSNLYGPESREDTVVGRALRQALQDGRIHLKALAPIRDFLFIEDAVDSMLNVIAHRDDDDGRAVVLNVGTGVGRAVGEMASALATEARRLGRVVDVVSPDEDSADSGNPLVLNIDRLRQMTRWSPGVSLEEGLRRSFAGAMASYCA